MPSAIGARRQATTGRALPGHLLAICHAVGRLIAQRFDTVGAFLYGRDDTRTMAEGDASIDG